MRDINDYQYEFLLDDESCSHSGSFQVTSTIKIPNHGNAINPFPDPILPRQPPFGMAQGGIGVLGYVIRDLLGSASVNTDTGILSRALPRRHPRYTWLSALEVVDAVGKERPDPVSNPFAMLRGKYGDFEYWILKVRFGTPPYLLLGDTDIRTSDKATPCEYLRFVEWLPMKPTLETIARRGVTFYFSDLGRQTGTSTFPGDQIFRANKGLISCIWHNVPVDMILAGRILPQQLFNGIGKLNAYTFPPSHLPSTYSLGWSVPPTWAIGNPNLIDNPGGQFDWGNTPANLRFTGERGFPPGTLLMLPPDILPCQYRQMVPLAAFPGNDTLKQLYTDLVDVRLNFLYFNPDTDETLRFVFKDLQPNLGPGIGNPQTMSRPDAVEPIRGHNLFPTPMARRGAGGRLYRWYAATQNSVLVGAVPLPIIQIVYPNTPHLNLPPTGPVEDAYLLYQYYNFERFFFCAGGAAGNFYI